VRCGRSSWAKNPHKIDVNADAAARHRKIYEQRSNLQPATAMQWLTKG
jgi:hypothetical protein